MTRDNEVASDNLVTLFLCGDVMTGRGIDQVLPHPGAPRLYESYVTSAREYVTIAEDANGPIPAPVAFDYIWGDALAELARAAPDLRIINLETAVTASEDHWPDKGIHYRMHPGNVPCLQAAGIDGCVLANNHVMDWGRSGLVETLETLERAGITVAGAGRNRQEAQAPAVFPIRGKSRVLVFGLGHGSSGVPRDWRAGAATSGVWLVEDLSDESVAEVGNRVAAARQPGDLAVVSVHWGGNWGYDIPGGQQAFARKLIDEAGVDVIHGHSSHHPRGIEVYKGHPIFYGCGDFLNDYEGITGYEEFRDDLTLMYFVTLDLESGELVRLEMTPMQIRRFRLQRPSAQDRRWLRSTMERECAALGTRMEDKDQLRFRLAWH